MPQPLSEQVTTARKLTTELDRLCKEAIIEQLDLEFKVEVKVMAAGFEVDVFVRTFLGAIERETAEEDIRLAIRATLNPTLSEDALADETIINFFYN